MPKKVHPADLAHLAALPKAQGFIASLHVGFGRYEKSPALAALDAARDAGKRLQEEHGTAARALIYAVLPNGRQVHIPDSYNAKELKVQDEIVNPPADAPATAQEQPAAEQTKENDMSATNTETNTAAVKGKGRKAKGAGKKAKAAKAKREPKEKKLGKRAQIAADAAAGKLPSPPDFSAATHARFRDKLKELVAAAKAGDLEELKKLKGKINPVSTSPKAMLRYAELAIMALKAQGK